MLKKGLIILELTFVFFLTILFSKPTITKAKPVTDADVVQHFETKDHEELIISYVLEDKKELFFKTTTENAIDIQALKKELGAQKIEEITSEEIKVTLDNPDKIDFKMLLTNKKDFTLIALDSNHNEIFRREMNEQTKDSRLAAEDDEWLTEEEIANFEEGTWTEADSLRLSEGPILEHSDGTTTRPYLYFGDYVYASQNISLLDAYQKKGDSRQVSLTAANSAILFADKGSRISDGLRSPNNHIYTTHYGDNQNLDTGLYNLEIENRPYGSPNSFGSKLSGVDE